MKATLINMQHGECICFPADNTIAIVDCGSRGPNKQQSISNAGALQTSIQQFATRAAVISHFHEDHFNCFSEAFPTKPFNQFYFPDIGFCDNHVWAQPARVHLAILNAMVEDIRRSTQKTTDFIRFLEWIIGHGKQADIYAVARADCFNIGAINVHAYWPEIQFDDASQDVYDEYCSFLEVGSDALSAIERISSRLAGIYNVDEVSDAFINGGAAPLKHLTLSVSTLAISDLVTNLENDFLLLRDDLGHASILKNKLTAAKAQQLRRIIERARRCADDFSIVAALLNSQTALITGDVPKKRLLEICQNDVSEPVFDMFKAPHHGTASHYAPYGTNICFKTVAICNGLNTSKCDPIYWEYTADALSSKYRIACTNSAPTRCNWLASHRRAPTCCASCPAHAITPISNAPVF